MRLSTAPKMPMCSKSGVTDRIGAIRRKCEIDKKPIYRTPGSISVAARDCQRLRVPFQLHANAVVELKNGILH
jgi:hypothetical protein